MSLLWGVMALCLGVRTIHYENRWRSDYSDDKAPSSGTDMVDDLDTSLARFWKVSGFRPCQKEAIEAAMRGQDTLVLLPTGGGKSLCYGLFAAHTKTTAIVISPLISLMVDQVKSLAQKGIPATFLGSAQNNSSDISDAIHGNMRVVFVTPEKMCSIQKMAIPNIGLVAVDEAHCVSEWGDDFRPEYNALGAHLRSIFGFNVPFMALTATATLEVQTRICSSLKLRNHLKLSTSFDRPNLTFVVEKKPPAPVAMDVLSRHIPIGSIAIVYVSSIKGVDLVADALQTRHHRVERYHGQMPNDERERRQRAFLVDGGADVMVATLAFGMGIDKSDVRVVVHWGACKSIESYFQQAGRAGRDDGVAKCIMFYGGSDWFIFNRMANEISNAGAKRAAHLRVKEMQRFCETTGCRRHYLVCHFGEYPAWTRCEVCDNCMRPREDPVNYTHQCKVILFAVDTHEGHKLSLTRLVAFLSGEAQQSWIECLDGYGSLRGEPPLLIRGLVDRLVVEKYMYRTSVLVQGYPPFYSFSVATEHKALWEDDSLVILLPHVTHKVAQTKQKLGHIPATLCDEDLKHCDTLKRLRTNLCTGGMKAYTVATDNELCAVVRARPKTLDELRAIPGFGPMKVANYGAQILGVVRQF